MTFKELRRTFRKQLTLQGFVWIGMLFLLVFAYIPMVGILIAFKQYSITDGLRGIFSSPWVGLGHFREFVGDYKFGTLVRNTLTISGLKILFCFPIPIVFAILLGELRGRRFKRFAQTISYFPHFISWVIVAGLCGAFLSETSGLLNDLLLRAGLTDKPIGFLTDPDYYWPLAVLSDIWKETGWWTIIFLAALAGIDPGLYEAAEIDGAGRIKRILLITLPLMKDSIVVVLILALGSFLGGGLIGSNFEQSYLLGNYLNNDKAEIVQTYAFKVGLADGRFAYAASVDFIQSCLSVCLVLASNALAKRLSGTGLF
ncbi:ABC transporter permease [Cohnella sp. GCM10020058]|uniref:ABC transporter permease n=1 Tax=Cohnella sp. GCM10020058 TaxID=3317330 RepID=UPI003625A777